MIESNKKTSMNTLSFMVLVLQIVLDTRTYSNRHHRLVSSCHETREPLTIEDMPTAYLIRVRIRVIVRNRLRVRFKDRVGLGLAVVAHPLYARKLAYVVLDFYKVQCVLFLCFERCGFLFITLFHVLVTLLLI